jgi:hypothetical protein
MENYFHTQSDLPMQKQPWLLDFSAEDLVCAQSFAPIFCLSIRKYSMKSIWGRGRKAGDNGLPFRDGDSILMGELLMGFSGETLLDASLSSAKGFVFLP